MAQSGKSWFNYGCVAKAGIILAQFPSDGEIIEVANKVIPNLDFNSPSSAIEQGNYMTMAVTSHDKITYVGICDKSIETKDAKSLLDKIKAEWSKKYGSSSDFQPNEKSEEFGPIIQVLLDQANKTMIQKFSQMEQTQRIEISDAESTPQMSVSDRTDTAPTQLSHMEDDTITLNEPLNPASMRVEPTPTYSTALRAKLTLCFRQYGLFFIIAIAVIILFVVVYLLV